MPTFGRRVGGHIIDVEVADSAALLAHQLGFPTNAFVQVPDGTLNGDIDNGDGSYSHPVVAPQPDPVPNNANNPYWPGYVPKTQAAFWGLIQAIFIGMLGSNEAGADRFYRLTSSTRAAATVKIIAGVDVVDPDDKAGAFLREVGFLTTTVHETDGQVLATPQEIAAIMQKHNWT